MSALFLKILNLSINASWLILAVIDKRILADPCGDRSKVIVEKGTKVDNLPSLGIGCDTTALSLFIGECVEPCTQPGSGSGKY